MEAIHYERIYVMGKRLHDLLVRWKTLQNGLSSSDVSRAMLRCWTPEDHDLYVSFAVEVGSENANRWLRTIVKAACPGLLPENEV